MASSPPTGLRGYIDDSLGAITLDGFGTVVDYLLETVPELIHPQSVLTYARMRHDPQLTAVLAAYARAVERAHYAIDPAGCRDEVAQQIADDFGLPIRGIEETPGPARRRRFAWKEHLRVAGLDRIYGHMFFEQAWALENGRWRLDVVAERMPQTITVLYLNTDGTLKSVEQGSPLGGTVPSGRTPVLTTADHRLVYYTREREGSNYFGNSLLRASYAPWLIKHELWRVHATSIRRFGMGIPEVQAPPGAMPAQITEAQRLASGIRAGDSSGVGLPNGFTFALKGMTGSTPDALAFIDYLDRQMTRSTLTSILDMAAAERGARSLGETVMDLMVLAQQTDAEVKAATATAQLIVPLVDANWGEDEPAPRIVVGDVGADVQLTAQDMNWLMQYGGLTPDQPLETYLRERYGLPPRVGEPNPVPGAVPGAVQTNDPQPGGAA